MGLRGPLPQPDRKYSRAKRRPRVVLPSYVVFCRRCRRFVREGVGPYGAPCPVDSRHQTYLMDSRLPAEVMVREARRPGRKWRQ